MCEQAAPTVTRVYDEHEQIKGYVVTDPAPGFPELPFAAVWYSTDREPGTANSRGAAFALVANDAFGECINFPTIESAVAAVLRDHDEVITEILG